MPPSSPDPHGWQTLDQKRLIHTPVFDLHLRRARGPHHPDPGNFYVFTCPDWVNVIAQTSAYELVMIRQFRIGSDCVEWEIPGGLIDPGDADPIAAGARELSEETGYAGGAGRIIGSVNPNPALQTNLCHTVLIPEARLARPPQLERYEDIETVALPVSEVCRMLDAGLIRHALVVAALLFYLRLGDSK
jgi:8-oxo-dGTP pyrophosphatase MutT (NUDIX family)